MVLKGLLLCFACYLIGGIPFGMLLGLTFKKTDIRKYGSGNIGTTNVLRTMGLKMALPTFILDFSKGMLAYFLATSLGLSEGWVIACGLATVIGHDWSIFLKFTGGKGVATAYGFILVACPKVCAIGMIVWILTSLISRYFSLASLLSCIGLIVGCLVFKVSPVITIYCIIATALIFVKHKANISRLLSGTENRFGGHKSK